MQIFEKNYVGVNHERKDITLAPLAFLTPYEDNAAGKKRRESVLAWLGQYHYHDEEEKVKAPKDTRIIPNIPRDGFRVVDFASRWSTSNKFARILDPNGFELEISIENLIDIMLYTVVDHGVIKGEMIWGREAGQNRLVPVDSEIYRGALREGQTLEIEVGDLFTGNYGKKFVYMGRGYVQPVAACGTEIINARPQNHLFYGHWGNPNRINPEYAATHTATGASEHVYLSLPDHTYDREDLITTRKKPMKVMGKLGKYDLSKYDPDYVFYGESAYHTADGQFFLDYDHSTFRYYTRLCMMRDAPFTNADLDSEKLLPIIAEKQ